MALKQPEALVRRILLLLLGCVGLVWGGYYFPVGDAADELRNIEGRLLRYESFSETSSIRILESKAALQASSCDVHSQRALLLLEMPLAEAALKTGVGLSFDQRINSMEKRAKNLLSCSPYDSFAWLLLFDIRALHGQLNEQAFDLLARSYETSPNEGWVSIRRIVIAAPLILVAPEQVRLQILHEFGQLVRHRFVEDAARAYLAAPISVRSLLMAQIDKLDAAEQRSFFEGLRRSAS